MIIFQFIKYQLSPAMFCGFLLKSFKKRLKTMLFSKKLQPKTLQDFKEMCFEVQDSSVISIQLMSTIKTRLN